MIEEEEDNEPQEKRDILEQKSRNFDDGNTPETTINELDVKPKNQGSININSTNLINEASVNSEESDNISGVHGCRGVSFDLSKDVNHTFSENENCESINSDLNESHNSDISIASSVALGGRQILSSKEIAAVYAKNALLEESDGFIKKLHIEKETGYFMSEVALPHDMIEIIESHPREGKTKIGCLEKGILKSMPAIYFKQLNTLSEKEIFEEIIPIKPKMKENYKNEVIDIEEKNSDSTHSIKKEGIPYRKSEEFDNTNLMEKGIYFSSFKKDPTNESTENCKLEELNPDLEEVPAFIPSGIIGGVAANMSLHGSFVLDDGRKGSIDKKRTSIIDDCDISDVVAKSVIEEDDMALNVSLDSEDDKKILEKSETVDSVTVACPLQNQDNIKKEEKIDMDKKKRKQCCRKNIDPETEKYDDPEYIMFGHRPVLRTLLLISISTALSELIKSLYTFFDGLYIASIGSRALSALSNITHIEALWQVLGAWLAVGANAAISSLVAKHKYSLAEFVISSVFIYGILIGALIAAFVVPFRENIIKWILGEGKEEILVEASKYIMPLAACSVFLVLYLAFGGVVQGLGYAKMYSAVSITCVVLNCGVFNPAFIFGAKLGIIGASWGTVISQAIGVIMYFIFFIWLNKKKTALVKFRPFLIFYFRKYIEKKGEKLPKKEKIAKTMQPSTEKGKKQKKTLTKLEKKAQKANLTKIDTRCSVSGDLISVGAIDGIASASAVAVTAIATIFVNKIALDADEDLELTITSMWTACLRIASLATSIMIGFSQAQLSMGSYAWSSRRYDRLLDIFKKTAIVMIISSLIITIIIEALADYIPYMFAMNDTKESFYQLTPTALRIFSATIFISGAQYVCCTHCQAVGLVNRGLWIAIFTQLVFGPTFFIIIYYITKAVGVTDVILQYYLCLISYNLNDVFSVITGFVFLTKPLKMLARLSRWQKKIIKLIQLKMEHEKEHRTKICLNLNNSILNTFRNNKNALL